MSMTSKLGLKERDPREVGGWEAPVGFRGWEGTQVRSGGAHSNLTLTAKIAMSLCGLGPL